LASTRNLQQTIETIETAETIETKFDSDQEQQLSASNFGSR
jgi:hypothetical protein